VNGGNTERTGELVLINLSRDLLEIVSIVEDWVALAQLEPVLVSAVERMRRVSVVK